MKPYVKPLFSMEKTTIFETIAADCWIGYAGNVITITYPHYEHTTQYTGDAHVVEWDGTKKCGYSMTGNIQTHISENNPQWNSEVYNEWYSSIQIAGNLTTANGFSGIKNS